MQHALELREIHTTFWSENLKGIDPLGRLKCKWDEKI
jgi:hypothetical protein